jgi:hypothetical protein
VRNLYKPISFDKPRSGPVCAPAPPACGPPGPPNFY